ncbi:outer membrane beta-barrel protein [Hydrogenophaga sp.]|uniref:outer membrane beta-barrel protein n=1 Tax=Hydrogenophaga sp. TaxID=1904254 RepID=UPI00272936D8|nr:outer membrane beta-barrel protein [Hydrogenophaga sp.]MDO9435629.1 outer membrane beta-barrel protein [Hydrogenophaga sp.]
MAKIGYARLAGAALALLLLNPLHAQEASPKWYAELGYTHFHFSSAADHEPVPLMSFSSEAAIGTVGYQLMPHLAVEGVLGTGIADVGVNVKQAGVSAPLVGVRGIVRKVGGLYIKPSLPVTDRIRLFARLGWVHVEHRFSMAGYRSYDVNNDSVTFGVGVQADLSPRSYVQVNWTNYFRQRYDADLALLRPKTYGLTVAYGMRF